MSKAKYIYQIQRGLCENVYIVIVKVSLATTKIAKTNG